MNAGLPSWAQDEADTIPQLPRLKKSGRVDIRVSIFSAPDDEAVLAQYQEMGVERAVLNVPSKGEDVILPLLDTYAALLEKFAS